MAQRGHLRTGRNGSESAALDVMAGLRLIGVRVVSPKLVDDGCLNAQGIHRGQAGFEPHCQEEMDLGIDDIHFAFPQANSTSVKPQ
jgi:hypothetical protein